MPRTPLDLRVLVLAPTARDAAITEKLLSSAGMAVLVCAGFSDLIDELRRGAGAILIPEECFAVTQTAALHGHLRAQPPWSDLPVLVLTHPGADSEALGGVIQTLGNVTLVERPVRVATLLSTVRTALRARERQYQIRGHLEERARSEEALRIADRRKDEFLATLGHELRNPLAPLYTALHLLKVNGLQEQTAVRMRGVMERQVGHLIRLVDDLLEVSRITRGLISVEHAPVDLALVVRSAIETGRPGLEAARHKLTLVMPAEPVTVQGDQIRLTQVFANLLTNAVKYTNAGGQISITVSRDGPNAIVAIRDNGIGIPSTQLESVFEMFTQVDRSNRRSQGGLGIGLTLVRSLVQLHGGRVEARSAGPGSGSEFIVELPAVAGPAPAAIAPRALRRLPPLRILVVDDNRDAADSLGALLSALGATASVLHSGSDVLQTIEAFRPAVVLMDIGMPEMDGYEVSRQIRAAPSHHGLLLIALTGWGQDDDRRRSVAAGFDHHLIKPPDIDKLHDILVAHAAAKT